MKTPRIFGTLKKTLKAHGWKNPLKTKEIFLLNIRNEERLVLQMLKLIKTTWLGVEPQENKVEP